jgi:spermidine synthase
MRPRALVLLAYACSGAAALVYEVNWTRLLTLHMGHSTAAASTVVAAFMGGLAIGSVLGGPVAARLTPLRALYAYIALECFVALVAIAMPYELRGVRPLLGWSYRNGDGGSLFAAIRLLSCLAVVAVPAAALGATFPMIVRWFVDSTDHAGRLAGELYAANTAGAAVGALAAGFVLIPWLGVRGATLAGVAFATVAALAVLVMARQSSAPPVVEARRTQPVRARRERLEPADRAWLGPLALGISGFAALLCEIVWTRVLSLVAGPTTYAVAATVTAFIAGLAVGAAFGSWAADRVQRPALCLAFALIGTAIATTWASALAGGYLPHLIAHQLVTSSEGIAPLWTRYTVAASLILPAAAALGAAFPLGLELSRGRQTLVVRPFSVVYAANTLGAIVGALAAGFVAIRTFGLQDTMRAVSALLVLDGLLVIGLARLSTKASVAALISATIAVAMLVRAPRWDRELLASGAYKYAAYVQGDVDAEATLKAGTLLYDRDGAASTVTVKRLTGALSLSIDGKVDASNAGDMLTQKVLGHLPLLLHADPHEVCIIGLGSGVTLASALVHPIARADIVEISPEVVEASRYFAVENRDALDDPRTHLIVGDGRSHLLLSSRQYDVIISEPSNPWMAGVAGLFTREFFTAVRSRLAPGGIICQWAHAYDITDRDLRSIVATFASVFPDGTIWLIGESDVLLVASTGPLDTQMANMERTWNRPGVAADLRTVSAIEPFALWSMFAGGPVELARYGAGATIQTDDRMALEFSAPHALSSGSSSGNAATLLRLLDPRAAPPIIRRARETAGAAEWLHRSQMLLAENEYATAYEAYATTTQLDPTGAALDGLVTTAVAAHREADALELLTSLRRKNSRIPALWIATSKLLAAGGSTEQAIAAANEACSIEPVAVPALEQLASIFADLGDAPRLAPVVERLQQAHPEGAATQYYAAALRFIGGDFVEALQASRRAIDLDPRYAAAHNLVGAIEGNLGHLSEAREAFNASLRLNPRDSGTYVNLGLLELSSGNRLAAADDFAEALSLDPQSSSARAGLAQSR